jgi:two-component system OmpR family sensor kinase
MIARVPIRIRLTLVFALATALVLAGAGWLVYDRVASDLTRALDEQLRSRAQDLSALVEGGGSLQSTGGGVVEPGESFAELVARDGRVVDATQPIGRTRLLTGAELRVATERPLFVNRPSVPGLDEGARVLALPVLRDGRRFVLVAGATRENRAEILGTLLAAFLIGGPIALALMSLAGYALAGAALRPIESMRRRAAHISASSLDERLPLPPADDEVRRLGETINDMLARVADGFAREQRFVADASHDLRKPLALLKTELELALRHARTRDELEQAIRSAAGEAERLSRIAEDLLLLARARDGRLALKLEPTDVGDVLHDVARRFEARAHAEGRELEVAADEPFVLVADRLRLEQALGNLVDNAFQHGGGRVTLAAARRNGRGELHVFDAGAGFPEQFLGRAFERFSRADDAREGDGSGLGLAIVDTIARAHHGEAGAANRTGGGADQWLSLPLGP